MRCRAASLDSRLAQAADSQFDTSVVAAFEAILAGADEAYRIAKRRDFLEFAQSSYDVTVDVCDDDRRGRLTLTLDRGLDSQLSTRTHTQASA